MGSILSFLASFNHFSFSHFFLGEGGMGAGGGGGYSCTLNFERHEMLLSYPRKIRHFGHLTRPKFELLTTLEHFNDDDRPDKRGK